MDAQRIGAGVVGGLAGGVLFGVMMHMMGMIGMVGGLVGQEGAGVGWVVHLVIAAAIGAGYGATFGQLDHTWGRAAGFGALYGLVWWVLGPLLIMPAWLGMPVLQVGTPQMFSLVGHLAYGLVTGLVVAGVLRQRGASQPAGAP